MRPFQKILAITLVLLLGATVYGLIRTNEPPRVTPSVGKGKQPAGAQAQLVDQSPLKTAQKLSEFPMSEDEKPLAGEALQLADREVDLAFDQAMHEAKDNPPVLQGEAKSIEARLEQAQKVLENDKAQVAQLTAAAAKATGDRKESLEDDLAIAQEDLNLAQNEVDDAKQDLIRAGGDPESRIQELYKEHKDGEKNGTSVPGNVPSPPDLPGLIHRYEQWAALHAKQLLLWEAKSAADASAAMLSREHDALDAKIDAEKAATPHLAHHAKKSASVDAAAAQKAQSHEDSANLLFKTKRVASEQKTLSMFDQRVDLQKQLSDNYAKWIDIVAAEQRTVVHHALNGVLIILAIALFGIYFATLMDKLLGRLNMDRRQMQSLHTVAHVTVRLVAFLLILLVIMGPPSQLGTFLGLATAGLTVGLKDFIVGFIGWFVLMGKNGIRLGDWVEINGVTGEVVEIGPFHTVLLETGNWTDSGHPTGRRVTFTNSFAIEGHYFNFSTSGQWLWDELQLVLPAGQDPYPIVKEIQKSVSDATKASAKQAEEEWRRATRSREMSSFSVDPAISVKPVVGGVEVAVRYITRANERYQLRAKLYQDAVDLLGGKNVSESHVGSRSSD
ncbi:MAG TPA: mechanosensitive ion channel domain-containing protein [Candidatus Acidoferrum sp.]